MAQPALWFTVAAAAAVPTIMTEDWVIGGTNGAIWLVLLAGEVRARQRPEPAAVVPDQSPGSGTLAAEGRQGASA